MSERFKKSKDKKQKQLGMNPSTAAHRLRTDIMFKIIMDAGYVCHQCGEVLTRDTFSIEHKEPWLDSENPLKLYFDLENIAFSHYSCNVGAARQPSKYLSEEERRDGLRKANKKCYDSRTPEENKKRRRKQYLKYRQ